MTHTIDAVNLSNIIDKAPEVDEKIKRKHIPPELKVEVKERDGNRCVVCGREKNLKVHHMIPYGESSLENLITLYEFCHEYVHKILKRKGYHYVSPALAIRLGQRI